MTEDERTILLRIEVELLGLIALVGFLCWLHVKYSLTTWTLTGLHLWMPPTEDDLKNMAVSEAAKVVKKKTKTAQRAEKRKTAKQAQATTNDYEGEDEEIDKDESGVDKSLTINRTQHIPLHPREVDRSDLDGEYCNFYRAIVINMSGLFILNVAHEVANFIYGPTHWLSDGVGMAFWWIIMSSLFIAVLMLILQIEFLQHATAAHDFALTLMVAIVSAIITMAILLTHDHVFDFRLEQGFNDLSERLAWMCDRAKLQPMSMSYATFSLLLSVMFGQLGLLLLFPTLRFVRSQIGAERAPQSKLTYALLYCNLILPFVACASWMHLPLPAFMQKQVDEHGESSALFDLRVGLLYLVGVIRVITFRTHIQNFFDMAPDRIMKLRNMPLNLKRWQRRRTWAADVKVPAHKVCGMVTQISDFLSGHCTFVMLPVVFFMSFVILLRTRGTLDPGMQDYSENATPFGGQIIYRSFASFFSWWICMYQAISIIVGYVWFNRRLLFSVFYDIHPQ